MLQQACALNLFMPLLLYLCPSICSEYMIELEGAWVIMWILSNVLWLTFVRTYLFEKSWVFLCHECTHSLLVLLVCFIATFSTKLKDTWRLFGSSLSVCYHTACTASVHFKWCSSEMVFKDVSFVNYEYLFQESCNTGGTCGHNGSMVNL